MELLALQRRTLLNMGTNVGEEEVDDMFTTPCTTITELEALCNKLENKEFKQNTVRSYFLSEFCFFYYIFQFLINN